jgi:hypothetical protein
MEIGDAFAWLLVAGLLLGSCTHPAACTSRLLLGMYALILPPPFTTCARCDLGGVAHDARDAAADGDAKVRDAGERAVVVRRALGTRLTWPPPPVPNTPRANVTPGPPQGQL